MIEMNLLNFDKGNKLVERYNILSNSDLSFLATSDGRFPDVEELQQLQETIAFTIENRDQLKEDFYKTKNRFETIGKAIFKYIEADKLQPFAEEVKFLLKRIRLSKNANWKITQFEGVYHTVKLIYEHLETNETTIKSALDSLSDEHEIINEFPYSNLLSYIDYLEEQGNYYQLEEQSR